jgi:hypothetical protein
MYGCTGEKACGCRTRDPTQQNADEVTEHRRPLVTAAGHTTSMGIIIVLLVLALIFGVGSLLEGLAWGFLIVVGLIAAVAVLGFRRMGTSSRT